MRHMRHSSINHWLSYCDIIFAHKQIKLILFLYFANLFIINAYSLFRVAYFSVVYAYTPTATEYS